MAQFVRPTADLLTNAAWTTTPYWSKLDEGAPGDDVYIDNGAPETTHIVVVDGATVTDPSSSTGHTIRSRHGKSSSHALTNRLTIQLRQGYINEVVQGTLIATLTDDVSMTDSSLVTATYTLTGTEADAITDYADLQFRCWVSRDSGAPGRNHRIDFIELEVPDAAGGGVSGTLAVTQEAQTSSASGAVVPPAFTGTSAVTQDDQGSTATGAVVPPAFTGTSAPTQDDQTSTASGTVVNAGVSGSLAVTQENQVATASGTFTPPAITGTASPTQDDQTASASGTFTAPAFTGTSASTQDDQTSAASGTVTTAGIAGSLAVTQDDQTSTATGTHVPAYTGTLAVTQDDQTLSATGDVGALTFWQTAPVAYTAAPVAYTPADPDAPSPW